MSGFLQGLAWLVLGVSALVGMVYLGGRFWDLWRIVRISLKSLNHLPQKYGKGSWAIITGGTDGIGYGFAEELSKLGFNIVLIARNKEKLEKVSRSLASRHQNQLITISKDFKQSNKDPNFYDEILEKTKHLDVSMLINNVGTAVGGGFASKFDEEYESLIAMNVYPIVFLTKRMLPQLLNRYKKHHRSAIINIASITGQYPQVCAEVYSASKAFDDFFSRSLAFQYEGTQLDVLSVCPCAVSTPLTRRTKKYLAIEPEQCAKGSLQWLGEAFQTNGHIIHNLQRWGMEWVPMNKILRIMDKKSQEFFETLQTR